MCNDERLLQIYNGTYNTSDEDVWWLMSIVNL